MKAKVKMAPLVLFFFVAVTCGGGTGCSEPQAARALAGQWGGDHISLSVHESGAVVEFDCAHGTIDGAIVLDGEDRFNVPGRYVREHGGPVRPDEPEDSQPARYTGSVDGRNMSLDVVFEDGSRFGPFRLTLGDEGRVLKCL